MNREEMTELMSGLHEMRRGSFLTCPARFDGKKDRLEVEKFLLHLELHKSAEHITEDQALRSLPMVLEKEAAKWWMGARRTAHTWSSAIRLIQATYAPNRPNHQIFLDIMRDYQTNASATKDFIIAKRALFAELPEGLLTEALEIDMIYGLLHHKIRSRIPREAITNFQELMKQIHHVEGMLRESGKLGDPSTPACNRAAGSSTDCNIRDQQQQKKYPKMDILPPSMFFYEGQKLDYSKPKRSTWSTLYTEPAPKQ